MKKYTVSYEGGESKNGGYAVDYMLADCDGVELYAEMPPVEGDETGSYEPLKEEILRQAEEQSVKPESLSFQYDA